MNCKHAISLSKDKVLIKIHVTASSSQSLFPAGYNNWRHWIEIKVKAAAKENKANDEVITKIAEYFNRSSKDISIVSGQKGREKIISIKNVPFKNVCSKIEESLHGL